MTLEVVKKEFDDLTRKIAKMEALRHQLDMMDTRGFEEETKLVYSKLHNVDRLPDAVKDFHTLKELIGRRSKRTQRIKHAPVQRTPRTHQSVSRLREQIKLLREKLRARATIAKVKFGSGVGILVNTTYRDFTAAVKAEIHRKVEERETELVAQLRERDAATRARFRARNAEKQKQFAQRYKEMIHTFHEQYQKKLHSELMKEVRRRFEIELNKRLEHEKENAVEKLVRESAQRLNEQKKRVLERLHQSNRQKGNRFAAHMARKEAALQQAFAEKHAVLESELRSIRTREARLARRRALLDERFLATRTSLERELAAMKEEEHKTLSDAKAAAREEIARHKERLCKRFAARTLRLEQRSASLNSRERLLMKKEHTLYKELETKRRALYAEFARARKDSRQELSLKLEKLKEQLQMRALRLSKKGDALHSKVRALHELHAQKQLELKAVAEGLERKEHQLDVHSAQTEIRAKQEHGKLMNEIERLKAQEQQGSVDLLKSRVALRSGWRRLKHQRETLRSKARRMMEQWKRTKKKDWLLVEKLRKERSHLRNEMNALRVETDAVQAAARDEIEKKVKALEEKERSLRASLGRKREEFVKNVRSRMEQKLAALHNAMDIKTQELSGKELVLHRTYDMAMAVLRRKLAESIKAEERRKANAEKYTQKLRQKKRQLDKLFETRITELDKRRELLQRDEEMLHHHAEREHAVVHNKLREMRERERKKLSSMLAVQRNMLHHKAAQLKRTEEHLGLQKRRRKKLMERERALLQRKYGQLRKKEQAHLEREEKSLQAALEEQREKIKAHGWKLEASLRDEKARVIRLKQVLKARFVRQRVKVQESIKSVRHKEKVLMSKQKMKEKRMERELVLMKQKISRLNEKATKTIALAQENAHTALGQHKENLSYAFEQRSAELKSRLHAELIEKLREMQKAHRQQLQSRVKEKGRQIRAQLEKEFSTRLDERIRLKNAEIEKKKHELEAHIVANARRMFG